MGGKHKVENRASEAKSTVQEKLTPSQEEADKRKAEKEAEKSKNRASENAEETKHTVQENVNDAGRRVQEGFEGAKEKVQNAFSTEQHQSERQAKNTQDHTHHQAEETKHKVEPNLRGDEDGAGEARFEPGRARQEEGGEGGREAHKPGLGERRGDEAWHAGERERRRPQGARRLGERQGQGGACLPGWCLSLSRPLFVFLGVLPVWAVAPATCRPSLNSSLYSL